MPLFTQSKVVKVEDVYSLTVCRCFVMFYELKNACYTHEVLFVCYICCLPLNHIKPFKDYHISAIIE